MSSGMKKFCIRGSDQLIYKLSCRSFFNTRMFSTESRSVHMHVTFFGIYAFPFVRVLFLNS